MDQHGQDKFTQNMKDLEDLAKNLQGDAVASLKSSVAILKKVHGNMDVETAIKMKNEMEKSGTSFEILNDELGKFKKAAERWSE